MRTSWRWASLLVLLLATTARGEDERFRFMAKELAGAADPRSRALAALMLGATQDPTAEAPLCHALGDASELVRAAAARALGQVHNPDAGSCLAGHAEDPSASVRDAVARAQAALAVQARRPAFLYVAFVSPGAPGPRAWDRGTAEPGASGPRASDRGTAEPSASGPRERDRGTAEPGVSGPKVHDRGTAEPGASGYRLAAELDEDLLLRVAEVSARRRLTVLGARFAPAGESATDARRREQEAKLRGVSLSFAIERRGGALQLTLVCAAYPDGGVLGREVLTAGHAGDEALVRGLASRAIDLAAADFNWRP